MTGSFSFVLDYIVDNFGIDNIFWTLYFINLILSVIAYKLGFARKLSVGKNIFVYFMLVLGNYITTIFSIMRLPMTESLVIICIVLVIYRTRLHMQRKAKNAS
ncbi:YlaH-like family protein [Oceanobacillus alkalisoli]|uniref:YlaH-like family protein n=1 Tax=Oceanobacillus alkalisoli TaxID=2925113 RepID=UPI001EE44A46|nr:YlaH-like family protein [Oceanobacillus alkalisoli]MCG5103616.1 YlaH-like family protein [Oceanobacillus alkalisoli]